MSLTDEQEIMVRKDHNIKCTNCGQGWDGHSGQRCRVTDGTFTLSIEPLRPLKTVEFLKSFYPDILPEIDRYNIPFEKVFQEGVSLLVIKHIGDFRCGDVCVVTTNATDLDERQGKFSRVRCNKTGVERNTYCGESGLIENWWQYYQLLKEGEKSEDRRVS